MAWVGAALIGVAASLEALRHTVSTPIDRVAAQDGEADGLWVDGSLAGPRPLDGALASGRARDGHQLVRSDDDAIDGRRALVVDATEAVDERDAASRGDESAAARAVALVTRDGLDGAAFGRTGTICHRALPRDWDGDGRIDLVLALSSRSAWRDRHEVLWLRNVTTDGERRYESGRTLVAWSSGRATHDDVVILRRGELPPTGARWRIEVRDATGDGRADLLVHDDYSGLLVLEQEVRGSAELRARLDRLRRARAELDLFWSEPSDETSPSRERRLERLQRELDEARGALDALDPRAAAGADAATSGDADATDSSDGDREDGDPGATGTTWVLERTGR